MVVVNADHVAALAIVPVQAGVLKAGLFEACRGGTPQGGPLSPLLSNLVLEDVDRALEHRGHRFVRCADDCTIGDASPTRRAPGSRTRFATRRGAIAGSVRSG